MQNEVVRILSRYFAASIVTAIAVVVVLNNFPIFGINFALDSKALSDLSPKDRVNKEEILGDYVNKQTGDITYFTTKTTGYDKAVITVTFKNDSPEQEMHIGFKDKPEWHYRSKPVDLPLINNIDWFASRYQETTLYQKNKKYDWLSDFYKEPPANSTVGLYYFDNQSNLPETELNNYKPNNDDLFIDTALRGSHTFYVYLKNEPFQVRIAKQDLNWYEGADELKIKVYKSGELLTEKSIADDGVTHNSKKVNAIQQELIQYEGEGNPESGIYKIVLEGTADTVIKNIKTNLNKLVFEKNVFPVNNTKVYSPEIVENSQLRLYTNASKVNVQTNHSNALQTIKINGEDKEINEVQTLYTYDVSEPITHILADNGDLLFSADGYFSFTKDSFFKPYPVKTMNIKESKDIENVDFLITDYIEPITKDGWKISTVTFNLNDAYYQNGTLSWIIKAPGLKERGGEILIKDISVEMQKEPIIE